MSALDDIAHAYGRARAEVDRTAMYTAITVPPRTCRYCGKRWDQQVGSKLDGHARCYVTPAFAKLAHDAWFADPAMSAKRLASALGVTEAVLRRWVAPTFAPIVGAHADPRTQRRSVYRSRRSHPDVWRFRETGRTARIVRLVSRPDRDLVIFRFDDEHRCRRVRVRPFLNAFERCIGPLADNVNRAA
jgi:hypothetical protein